jgi:hypothetical protein
MLTPKEVAVLLDSEGTICITLANLRSIVIPVVSVEMTDQQYPRLMHEQFGGYLTFKEKKNPKHSPSLDWNVRGKKCEEVLTYALAELVIKKVQAQAVLLFASTLPSTGTRPKVTDKQLLLRWTLYELVKKLNKKGPSVNDVIEQLETTEF